jgi:predicted cupin superfamily sugar epimerase
VHREGGLFFGTAKESENGDSGVQGIGAGVVEVTAGDYFELIARQTSASAKNVAADELTWFALEVVE